MRGAIVLPARLHSTRLPEKCLKADTGQPLICHTVDRAVEIRNASGGTYATVIVAADDQKIVDAVRSHAEKRGLDVQAVLTDPKHKSGSDRIAEAARALPADIDAILNVQGDEPDIPVDAVLQLTKFYQETTPDIATLVYPVASQTDRENPALVKAVLGSEGRALYFSRANIPFRREENSVPTYGHVGVYLYRRASLERFVTLPEGILEATERLEQLRALENGRSIRAAVLSAPPAKGIDTPEDYAAFVASVGKRR
jgi:3-deoxy-manno-octulosonate cytidylyltransferase (CMP-KDO synthetase)